MFPNVKKVLKFQKKKSEYDTALCIFVKMKSYRLKVEKRFLYSPSSLRRYDTIKTFDEISLNFPELIIIT